MPLLALFCAVSLATFAHADDGPLPIAKMLWQVADRRAVLPDITFPIAINGPLSAVASGYLFGQGYQFRAEAKKSPQYDREGSIGIMPPANGSTSFRAIFTTNTPNARALYRSCKPKDVSGLSCEIEFPGRYNHTYDLRIHRVGTSSVWTATIKDSTGRFTRQIGSFYLPSQGLFDFDNLRYYYQPPKGTQKPCKRLPYGAATFGVPSTSDKSIPFEFGYPNYRGDPCFGDFPESHVRNQDGSWTFGTGFQNLG